MCECGEEKKRYRSVSGYASLPPSSGAEELELSLSGSQKHITSNYQSYSATDTNGKDKISTYNIDCFSLSPKTAKSIEIAVILIAMFITLCLLSTPIILRETHEVQLHSQNNCSEKNCSGNSTPAIDIDNSSITINFTCRDDFYEINNTCTPRCDKWEQSPHDTTIAVLVVQNVAAWLGLLVGIIVIISSCIRYKNMFTFPSVFLIYMTIDVCIIAIFVIISSFDRPALYCSSKNLTESILNPTTFCTVAGATFHYFLVSIMLWWFFHVCSIFYKVMFPFTAKRTEKYQKYIHIILVIIGILLPLPAVVVTLTKPNFSYTFNAFPPLLCVSRNANMFYYSAILVVNVLLAIGVSLFIPMFWVVHKHQGIFRPKKRALNIGFAETKILFVLCFYVVFGVLTLCHFGLSTQDQEKFIKAVTEYFTCEYFGDFPAGRCERKYFERYVYPGLTAATYFFMGLIPVANLVFVVDWRRVSQIMKRFSNRCCHRNFHEVEIDDIHSNLSPHPDPSTYEINGVKE